MSTPTATTPSSSDVPAMAREAEIAEHWIDGEWIGSDTVSESMNPATGAVLGPWADCDEAEARAAIVAARRVFGSTPWSRDRTLRRASRNGFELGQLSSERGVSV